MRTTPLFITLMFMLICPTLKADGFSADEVAIRAVLDDFHDAAAKGDRERYLAHFTDNAVFLGTDEWERWPLNPDFSQYVANRFNSGVGWVYKSEKKHIAFSFDRQTAWFDETSVSQRNGSRFRGSGVLQKIDGEWKIAHYVLSFLVYNEIADEVAAIIGKEALRQQSAKSPK